MIMNVFKHFFTISILITASACVATLNTNKSADSDIYDEDLTAYLPIEITDSVVDIAVENEQYEFDSTLIITDRLDSALLIVNNYYSEKTSYIEGLTIQLYSGIDRSQAKEVQMRVYRHFPDSHPKIIFDQPNYKVRMEKFYSQLEAYPVFKSVQAKFSKAILVPTRISVSKN